MPDTREKLIELVQAANDATNKAIDEDRVEDREDAWKFLADHLIANGVTVQKWIPVAEAFPEDVYGKDREKIVVLVRTKSGNVSQCARIADYEIAKGSTLTEVKWIKNGQFYWSKGKKVTHWMPLPQPPKGE